MTIDEYFDKKAAIDQKIDLIQKRISEIKNKEISPLADELSNLGAITISGLPFAIGDKVEILEKIRTIDGIKDRAVNAYVSSIDIGKRKNELFSVDSFHLGFYMQKKDGTKGKTRYYPAGLTSLSQIKKI